MYDVCMCKMIKMVECKMLIREWVKDNVVFYGCFDIFIVKYGCYRYYNWFLSRS